MNRLALLALLSACRYTAEFHCDAHEDCRQGSAYGFCERSGYCTVTDISCESQRRYSSASDELDGTCLEGVVTGRLVERAIVNDADAQPIVQERILPAAEVMMSAVLEDGTMPAVDYRELDGAFSFEAPPGMHYELHYTHESLHYLQHVAPHLELAPVAPGRPDRMLFTRATFISFLQMPTITGNVWITSTGVWSETNQGQTSSSFMFNWLNAKPLSGDLGLLDSDQHDRLYFLFFGTIDMYSTITAYAVHELKLTETMTTTAMATLATVVNRDLCTTLVRTPTADLARVQKVNAMAAGGSAYWLIAAAPPRELPPWPRLQLAARTYTTATDDTAAVKFVNVYPGTSVVAHNGTAYNVPMAYESNSAKDLALGMETISEIANLDPSCAGMTNTEMTVGIAGNVKIGPTKLDANGKAVSLQPPMNQVITWDVAVDGPVHSHIVLLYELSGDGSGGTTITVRGGWETGRQQLFVPKTMLVSGHTYVLAIYTELGTPNAHDGDYVTASLPRETIASVTPTFKIN